MQTPVCQSFMLISHAPTQASCLCKQYTWRAPDTARLMELCLHPPNEAHITTIIAFWDKYPICALQSVPQGKRQPPCVTFRLVVVSLWGPGQSPVLPFACCVGSLLSVGRCTVFHVRLLGLPGTVQWGQTKPGAVCHMHRFRTA